MNKASLAARQALEALYNTESFEQNKLVFCLHDPFKLDICYAAMDTFSAEAKLCAVFVVPSQIAVMERKGIVLGGCHQEVSKLVRLLL